VCLYVYECALLERWVYFFCVMFPALAFSYLFVLDKRIHNSVYIHHCSVTHQETSVICIKNATESRSNYIITLYLFASKEPPILLTGQGFPRCPFFSESSV